MKIFYENNKRIYITKSNSANKAFIVQLKNNRYAALKSLKNKFINLDTMLTSFSHKELREHTLNYILKNKINDLDDISDINN